MSSSDVASKEVLAHELSDSIRAIPEVTDERVGAVLVGLGRAGGFHMASFLQMPEVAKLEWVVDSDVEKAERTAKRLGCKWSGSLDTALADPKVQFVIIASTTDTHFPFIMQSLKAGKAIFTEKPISHDAAEVQQAVDFAKSQELLFVCGFQRRVDENFREVKRQISANAIGQLKIIKSCSRDNPVPPIEYLRTSGGIFHDMLVHDFDMLHFVSGGQWPESVTSVGHCYNAEIAAMNDLDMVAVMFKFPSGLVAMADTCRDAAYGYDQRLEVFGEKGMLTARNETTSSVELATVEGHLMPPAKWSFPERYNKAYTVELVEFVAAYRAGKDSCAQRLERECMMRHPDLVRMTTAAELSWKLGRTVMLKDLDALMAEAEALK